MGAEISFEKYRDSIIEDFKKSLSSNGFGVLAQKKIDLIKERFESHRECYVKNTEKISICCYGNRQGKVVNLSIECHNCNSLIIDTDILFLEEEE